MLTWLVGAGRRGSVLDRKVTPKRPDRFEGGGVGGWAGVTHVHFPLEPLGRGVFQASIGQPYSGSNFSRTSLDRQKD